MVAMAPTTMVLKLSSALLSFAISIPFRSCLAYAVHTYAPTRASFHGYRLFITGHPNPAESGACDVFSALPQCLEEGLDERLLALGSEASRTACNQCADEDAEYNAQSWCGEVRCHHIYRVCGVTRILRVVGLRWRWVNINSSEVG